MQTLKEYIKELLLFHDCVIIPQFGGFVANYKPAYYNEASQIFNPPSKEITFNSKLVHNDGLLCQQIMKYESKTFAEALERIRKEVELSKKTLTDSPLNISGIGLFKQLEDGLISFSPDYSKQFLLASYGLNTFSFKPLHQHEGGKLKLVKTPEKTDRKNRFSLSGYAAAVAAIILVFFFLFPVKVKDTALNEASFIAAFDSLKEQKDAMVVNSDLSTDTKEIAEIADPAPLALNTHEDVVSDIQAEVTTKSQPEKPNNISDKREVIMPSVQYHIIIASLATLDQAREFVNKNCKEAFPQYRIIESNGRYRISIDMFTDKDIALPVLDTFRETNKRYKDAWLLTIKSDV